MFLNVLSLNINFLVFCLVYIGIILLYLFLIELSKVNFFWNFLILLFFKLEVIKINKYWYFWKIYFIVKILDCIFGRNFFMRMILRNCVYLFEIGILVNWCFNFFVMILFFIECSNRVLYFFVKKKWKIC